MGQQPVEPSHEEKVAALVGEKAARRREARARARPGVWFGIGMFGLVGWAVAVPTVAGILLGVWLDAVAAARISWTLSGLAVGVALGCLNAWWWVRREGGHHPAHDRHEAEAAQAAPSAGPADNGNAR